MDTKERERAKLLYVRLATRQERDRLAHTEGLHARRPGPMTRRQLAEAQAALASAESVSGDIFESVMRGEVEP